MPRTARPPRRQQPAPPKPSDPPLPRAAWLTCSDIEAIVYARVGWAPPPGSPQECVHAAAVVGYSPGLASQITRPE